MGHEGTLVSGDQKDIEFNFSTSFSPGGAGGYQAVYFVRDELTLSICQYLAKYLIPLVVVVCFYTPSSFRDVYLNDPVW